MDRMQVRGAYLPIACIRMRAVSVMKTRSSSAGNERYTSEWLTSCPHESYTNHSPLERPSGTGLSRGGCHVTHVTPTCQTDHQLCWSGSAATLWLHVSIGPLIGLINTHACSLSCLCILSLSDLRERGSGGWGEGGGRKAERFLPRVGLAIPIDIEGVKLDAGTKIYPKFAEWRLSRQYDVLDVETASQGSLSRAFDPCRTRSYLFLTGRRWAFSSLPVRDAAELWVTVLVPAHPAAEEWSYHGQDVRCVDGWRTKITKGSTPHS